MRLSLTQSRQQFAKSQLRLNSTPPREERRAHPGWVAAIVVLTTIILVMSLESLAVALPAMMTSMRVGLQEMSWTMTGFLVSRTLFVGTAGWLGNRLGNRNLFALSLAVFLGGALGCGLAWRFEALVIWRIVQGMGAGPLLPLFMVILHESFPPEQRGLAQSFYMIGDAAGAVCGRGLAGYLIESLGWRSIFYIHIPLGLIALVGLLIIVPNRRDEQAQSFDPLGLLFLSGFVACLLVGLQSGAQDGWEHTGVRVLLMLAAASFAAFLVTECRVTEPLIDLSLFRRRAYSLICLISAINMIGLIGVVMITPIMLQRLLHLTPIHAGLILVPGAVAWGVAGPIGGKLGDRMDARWLLVASFTLNIWTLWQLASVTLETPSTVLSWRVTCLFCTMALSFTPLFLVCMRSVPTRSLRIA
ncbi:DHA2 family efflux MFS transporter permease subunit [Candidatus Entotheonella palauensis]|uniref:DHA2 family efflux MFS transporter permease subunit n=1 Tax=Candidatus Entotheonella palauensis TaxID=93172 RepID=UPI000B8005C3|nr:DHA2 family efflux MFS transporter permease subunit [Candidatus Entotheonella palauensis]